MNAQKQLSAKKAFALVTERARRAENFALIATLGLLYKSGQLTRDQVVDKLNEARVTRDDLRKFREQLAPNRSA